MIFRASILAILMLSVLLCGSACSKAPVVCCPMVARGLVEQSWGFTEVSCMEPGQEYTLPNGRQKVLVVAQADGEYSKCLACRDSAGKLMPLVAGERTFGYAVCRNAPQYLLVFDNFASKQNRVLLYKLSSSFPVLCYDGAEHDACFEWRVTWSVASWNQQGILLEGNREDSSSVYCLLPME